MESELQILYDDGGLVAVNKPHGLLVHRSAMAGDAQEFALQMVRSLTGRMVYPAHRIDRKTAGVLLFTTTRELNSLMQQAFMLRRVEKTYHAVLRGWLPESGTIEYALKSESGQLQDAVTHYKCVARSEMPWPSAGFSSSRYSFAEVVPHTGRMHQIRRHFAHIFHPVLGDVKHGCNKQNRLLREQIGLNIMLLHARSLGFVHPLTGQQVQIEAPYQPDFVRFAGMLGFGM
ncbi:MAG: pseudouridylate synthase [Bacteroidetes bacterium]|nr:pseudouridylate synthase [Bacteroidota bacterium]